MLGLQAVGATWPLEGNLNVSQIRLLGLVPMVVAPLGTLWDRETDCGTGRETEDVLPCEAVEVFALRGDGGKC